MYKNQTHRLTNPVLAQIALEALETDEPSELGYRIQRELFAELITEDLSRAERGIPGVLQ